MNIKERHTRNTRSPLIFRYRLWRLLPCLALLLPTLGFTQTPNRPVNEELTTYEFTQHQPGEFGYYLIAPFKNPPGGATNIAKPIVLDQEGYVAWYRPVTPARNINGFSFDPVNRVYTFIEFFNPAQVWYTTLDTLFQHENRVEVTQGALYDAHDFFLNSSGIRVLSATRDSSMDLSAYVFNGNSGSANAVVRCFVIQEVDSANNLLWEWNSCDHLHPTEAYDFYGYNGTQTFDYCHGNSIEEDTNGDYLLSFRHLNAVVKIDRASGNVVWRLGGKQSDFSFVNDNGFSGQHDARWLPNGNLSLFDNGNMATPQESRAVEYALSTTDGTATRVWEHRSTPGVFGEGMGSFSVSGAARAVSYGIVWRPAPSIETVDLAGNALQTLVFSDSVQTYRTQILDEVPLPARPTILCDDANGTPILSVDAGVTDMLWSTNETTATIIGQANTTYQYWHPQGVGMLGSHPITIDAQGSCPPPVGIPEPVNPAAAEQIGIYDLLGRKVDHPLPGRLYIYRFSDGSAIRMRKGKQ